MGTRGLVGFVTSSGVMKAGYNQFDSYPAHLGVLMLEFLQKTPHDVIEQDAERLKVVDGKKPPTQQEKNHLRQYADLRVSEQSMDDWYCLLRETQGNPELMLEAGYVEDSKDFGYDSLFCEWAYLVCFDTNTFEVYKGFNQSNAAHGRWKDGKITSSFEGGPKYGPIALVATWPLSDLPSQEEILALEENEED